MKKIIYSSEEIYNLIIDQISEMSGPEIEYIGDSTFKAWVTK